MFSRRPPEQPRSKGAIAFSVALHVVIAVALMRVVLGSNGVAEWLIGRSDATPREKIEMVAVYPPRVVDGGGAAVTNAPRAAARGPQAPLRAPTAIPTTPPDAPASGQGGSGGGTGTGVGSGSGSGVSRGIIPGYDPRLYPGVPEPERVPRSPKERIDSVIAERFARYSDSLSLVPKSNVTEDGRGDLAITRGGKKYGWTQRGIVLGNFTLPAPLLALLPLNRIGGNPSSLLRSEYPFQMRSQIQAGAQVALNAETFNDRVKRIRERRDRERKESRDPQPQPAVPVPVQPVP
jgi:hypothetical protein